MLLPDSLVWAQVRSKSRRLRVNLGCSNFVGKDVMTRNAGLAGPRRGPLANAAGRLLLCRSIPVGAPREVRQEAPASGMTIIGQLLRTGLTPIAIMRIPQSQRPAERGRTGEGAGQPE